MTLSVNGKQLLITRERLIRGRIAIVLIAIATIQYCLFLVPFSLLLLPIPSVRVRKLYRRWCSTVQLVLMGFVGYIVEFVCKIRIVITGADELLHVVPAKPLIISNHRCEIDWLFLLCLSLRLHRLSALKIASWEEVANVPFIGWLVQVFLFPTLCGRDKVKDLATLRNTVEYLTGIQHPVGVSLVLFPEGATVSDTSALEKSRRYAEIMGIDPKWSHVLIPRTPGMYEAVRSLNRLNALDSVIDVTIGYLDFSPFETSSLSSFWKGTYPREVHMHLSLTRWVDIPTDFDSMKDWLLDKFSTKERILDKFYSPIHIMYQQEHLPAIKRGTSGASISSESSDKQAAPLGENDEDEIDDGQISTDQFSTTSTHLSNLATFVAFSEDIDSSEPAEETLSKDMRFIQYISNSYVISAVVAIIVNFLVISLVVSYPEEVLIYTLSVCLLFSVITRYFGGVNVLEMEFLPVQVDLSYGADLCSASECTGYKPKSFLQTLKELFIGGKKSEHDYNHRDKDKYIQALRDRNSVLRKVMS